MSISVGFLSFMVSAALLLTAAAPIVLLILWLRDRKRGQIW